MFRLTFLKSIFDSEKIITLRARNLYL